MGWHMATPPVARLVDAPPHTVWCKAAWLSIGIGPGCSEVAVVQVVTRNANDCNNQGEACKQCRHEGEASSGSLPMGVVDVHLLLGPVQAVDDRSQADGRSKERPTNQ